MIEASIRVFREHDPEPSHGQFGVYAIDPVHEHT
jgi:hypothetical protein